MDVTNENGYTTRRAICEEGSRITGNRIVDAQRVVKRAVLSERRKTHHAHQATHHDEEQETVGHAEYGSRHGRSTTSSPSKVNVARQRQSGL